MATLLAFPRKNVSSMASKPTFSDEIVTEIFLRLPVKSILRFKTLSKHYYSVIHSKFFIRRHLSLGRINDKLFNLMIVSPMVLGTRTSVRLFDRRGQIKVLVGPPSIAEESSNIWKRTNNNNQDNNIIIFGPVNGLYCVADCTEARYGRRKRIALWNPSTREHFLLPHVPQTYSDSDNELTKQLCNAGFCFREYHSCGFGYDDIADDYKVVLIYGFVFTKSDGNDLTSSNKNSFYIFSVSKGEWTNPEGCIGVDGWNIKSFFGVFVCGACHWLYESSPDSGDTILALDMSDESHKIISFPTVGDEYKWSNTVIVTVNGCLALVNAQGSLSFDVWIMSKYGDAESWSILHRVSLPPGIFGRFLGIVKNRFYVGEEDGSLVSYDLDSKDKECYGILDGRVGSLVPYEESLVRIIQLA